MKVLPTDQNSSENWQETLFLHIFVKNLQEISHEIQKILVVIT